LTVFSDNLVNDVLLHQRLFNVDRRRLAAIFVGPRVPSLLNANSAIRDYTYGIYGQYNLYRLVAIAQRDLLGLDSGIGDHSVSKVTVD